MNQPNNITDQLIGGRLIPRTVFEQNLSSLVTTFRNIVETNDGFLISGVMVNSSRAAYPKNSVNPAWRNATMSLVVGAYVIHSLQRLGTGTDLHAGYLTIPTKVPTLLDRSSSPMSSSHR